MSSEILRHRGAGEAAGL